MDDPDSENPTGDNASDDRQVVPRLQPGSPHDPQRPTQPEQDEKQRDCKGWYVPTRRRRPFKFYRKQFIRAGADRHIELVLAAVVAGFVVTQTVNSCNNNRSTTGQVNSIIAAANSAVNKLQAQADNFGNSVQATQELAIVSDRAYLVPLGAGIDNSLNAITLSVINIGHLPSTDGMMTIFEMTVRSGTPTKDTVGFPIGDVLEGHWSQWHMPDATYASPPMLWTPLPSFSQADFSQRKIAVAISGTFSYRDGFDKTPVRHTAFCFLVFYDSQRHGLNSVSCDEERMTARIKRAIRFPKNRVNEP